VRISYEVIVNSVGSVTLGIFTGADNTITLHAIPQKSGRGSYLFTLSHEARHAWQFHFSVAPTEADCDDFAKMFLKRYASGPTCSPFTGPILGEPVRCSFGHLTLAGHFCEECEARKRQQADLRAKELQREARDVALTKALKKEHAREQAALHDGLRWRREIDNHPSNGTAGYWLVDGTYTVEASSAGEAVIKVARLAELDRPTVKFLRRK
jgi:hypothetical protein